LTGTEIRALKRLRREHPASRYVFVSNRGTQMNRQNLNVLSEKLPNKRPLKCLVHFARDILGSIGVCESGEGKVC
jgi:hypothetical protein